MKSRPKSAPKGSALYMCAPVNALVEGLYEQKVPLREIKRHGDFGLGTFDDLDGEMILLDGRVYQVNSAGRVAVVDDAGMTPFACVTFYRPISHEDVAQAMDYQAFLNLVQQLLPSPNIFYAIRMEGTFDYVKTRSVPRQENYRPLAEATKDQPVFEFQNVAGTLAGFITPSFMGAVNVPGLHLHFLSADFTRGGHLLECRPRQGRIGVQFISRLELSLPMTFDYLTQDFTRNVEQDLNKAEK